MNVVKEIQRINQLELERGNWSDSSSWHARYKDTAWIYAGNLDYDLTEGDIVCIFSQYGEIIHIELVRDQKTGKARGFAFIQYEDQRSTILAVDNLNGATVLGRTIRVDHTFPPKKRKRKDEEEEEEEEDDQPKMNVAPQMMQVGEDVKSEPESDNDGLDDEDPMAAYFKNKHKKSKKKKSSSSSSKSEKKSSSKKRSHESSSSSRVDEHKSRSRNREEEKDDDHHHRHRDRSRDRDYEKSSSRHRDRESDRERDRYRERDHDRDRHREKDHERYRDRDSDRYRRRDDDDRR